MTITITLNGSGAATITGEALSDDLRTQPVNVAEGIVAVDLSAPDRMPHCHLDDATAFPSWFHGLYGDAINDALLDLLERLPEAEANQALSVELSDDAWDLSNVEAHTLDAVQRAALGDWLLRWWPSEDAGYGKLDPDLVLMERLATADGAPAIASIAANDPLLFDESEVTESWGDLLDEIAVRAQPLVTDNGTVCNGHADEVVWRAVRDATHRLYDDSPAYVAVAQADEQRAFELAVQQASKAAELSQSFEAEEVQELIGEIADELSLRRRQRELARTQNRQNYALAAGVGDLGDEDSSWDGDVDPIQVPPRSVSGRLPNVHTTWDKELGVITIVVDAGDEPVDSLAARIARDGIPLPLLVTLPLTEHGYVIEVPDTGLANQEADIFHDSCVSRRRSSEDVADSRRQIEDFLKSRAAAAQDGPFARFAGEPGKD